MDFVKTLERFYKMEADLKLFERKDSNNIHYWDIFRFAIFDELTEGGQNQIATSHGKVTLSKLCKMILNVFYFAKCLTSRKCYFFYLASRNKYGYSSVLFDQNAQGILAKLDKNSVFINESYAGNKETLYDEYPRVKEIGCFSRFFPGPAKVPTEEFSTLVKEIISIFPSSTINVSRLANMYIRFYKERQLYSFIFKRTKPKKIFVTQNGIQKGLFAAAKDCNVPVFEFQHGIVNDGHLAYTYPSSLKIEEYVYRPSFFMTLSDFWLKDCYMPYTKTIVLGNDYFKPTINSDNPPIENRILIVSSSFMRNALFDFLEECKNSIKDFERYDIIYKLHPNEFQSEESYKFHFQSYKNVTVSTVEKNIAQWMESCSTMVTILSTAAYEALQCKRKVIVLKRLNYQMMKPLFDFKNVYLVDNANEISIALNKTIENEDLTFFSSFNNEIANDIINS